MRAQVMPMMMIFNAKTMTILIRKDFKSECRDRMIFLYSKKLNFQALIEEKRLKGLLYQSRQK